MEKNKPLKKTGLKYWLLTSEYPPFYGGGISTYCYFTAKMLTEQGHAVSVFINDSSVKDIAITADNNVRIIRFNPSRTNTSHCLGHITHTSYEFGAIIKKFIEKEGKPDIIESQEYQGIAYYLMQYKYLQYDWCSNIPIIITAHSPSFIYLLYNHVPVYRYPNYWIGEMERYCLQAADLVIFPSSFLPGEIKNHFSFTNKNIRIIPNPYELPVYDNTINTSVKSGEIIFYGKLSVQKGTFKLLEYFTALWAEGSDLILCLIGGQDIVYHPEEKTMGDIVKEKYKKFISNGKLILKGKIRPDQITTSLGNARLIIIPSIVDNLPYVVLEMMGMGQIVLVSKQGGQAEVINDSHDGFIFDHDHPETFFNQLNRILALSEDQRVLISSNARKKIKSDYNFQVIYQKKIEAVKELSGRDISTTLFPFIRPNQELPTANHNNVVKDLLSVVITFYNLGKYIDEAIQSVEASDYTDREIIIIDDGSTDPLSIKKLDQYRNRPGVRLIRKKNKGLADTRNTGAISAKGEYLAFLDADDKVDKSYYSKAIRVLANYKNVYFAGAWTQYFGGSNKVWPTFNPEAPISLYQNTVNSSGLVYKRSSFLKAGMNDSNMLFPGLEDYESLISLLSQGYNGVVLPEILFHYRVRSDSMIRGVSAIKRSLTWQYISQKHNIFYDNFSTGIFNLVNANGPAISTDNPSLDYYPGSKIFFGSKTRRKFISLVKKNSHIRYIAYKIYRLINR